MYIYIKNKHDLLWRDITEYVDFPTVIYDTKDGKDTSAKLNVFFDDRFKLFDITKPIPPKTYVKISEVDDEELENENNTYWFQISKSNNIKQRKSVKDSYGDYIVGELWEHVLELSEYITILNETHMPNYTITQPKSEFFDMYRRSRGARFDIGHYFEQNGKNMTLPMGSKRYINEARHEDKIVLDYKDNKHYVEINDINKLSYDLDISIDLMKSAPSKTIYTLIWQRNVNITAHNSKALLLPATKINNSTTTVKARITYYDINDNVIRMYGDSFEIKSSGANVINDYNVFSGITKITGFQSPPQTNTFNMNLPKDINADKVVVDFTYYNDEEWAYLDNNGWLEYDDGSFRSENVVGFLDNITIQATSEAHTEEFEEDFITYYDFLEKATFDYNLNKRDKITLSEDLKTVLSEVAKEGEWVDFTYKELVERLFKYVGIVPTLSFDNVLSYVKTQHVGVNLDEEFQQGEEKEHVGDDFFDTILSNSKNLVSEKDFVKEYLSLSSLSDEFEQITSSNLGFLTSKNIYYVANGIINIPNLEFNFSEWGGGVINTNMNKPYHWDITTRLFEKDIYDSFPNVRFDGAEGGRAKFDLFSKGNTLYYTSGDNIVSGLGHQADNVPSYHLFSESTLTDDGQYAIIETLIVLAISQIPSESIALEVAKNYKEEFTLQDFEYQNMALELTYAPIFKELTTKYVSNMAERRGLNSQKKVNMNERVVSYQESEEVLRREMDRKGNVKETYSENYTTLSEVLPNLSIIEGNKYITSKVITLDNNAISVEYILQKDFIMENDDIRLGVEFERYNVPYEYVLREIIIENHLLFNNRPNSRYGVDESGITKNFIEQMLIPNGNDWNNPIYSNSLIETVSENINAMTRVGKIENRFSMILSGEYLDNYTAGTQRYLNTAGSRLLFSQPFRYTDTTGKFESVKNLVIGWNNINHNSRLSTNINMFPNGENTNLDYKLFEENEVIAIRKDGREKISYNLSSYLISENDNIKWYSFSPILKVGALVKDYNFIDDMKLGDVDYELIDSDLDIKVSLFSPNMFEVKVEFDNDYSSLLENGVVFIGDYRGGDILLGLLKNPYISENYLKFYISTTRYGYKPKHSYDFQVDKILDLGPVIDYSFKFGSKEYNYFNESVNIYPDIAYDIKFGSKEYSYFNESINIYPDIAYDIMLRDKHFMNVEEKIVINPTLSYDILQGDLVIKRVEPIINITPTLDYGVGFIIHEINNVDETIIVEPSLNYTVGFPNFEETLIDNKLKITPALLYDVMSGDRYIYQNQYLVSLDPILDYGFKFGDSKNKDFTEVINLASTLNYTNKVYDKHIKQLDKSLNIGVVLDYKPMIYKHDRKILNNKVNLSPVLNYSTHDKINTTRPFEEMLNIGAVLNYSTHDKTNINKSFEEILNIGAVLNYSVGFDSQISRPDVVGHPTCVKIGGTTYLKLTIKNNHNESVSISINGKNVASNLNANSTRSISITYPLPGTYSLSIKALKNVGGNIVESNALNLNGNIPFCSVMA